MKNIRFALLGCGRISRKHCESIIGIDNAELAAVCDIDEAKAKAVGDKFGVPYYTDHDRMLANEAVDVVNVLTPSGLHAEHVIDVVNKFKKHIVCEKPMALTLADADKMIEVCQDKHVHLFVVKQNRFNLPVVKLREALEKGRFGKLVLGTVRVRWARDQKYYDHDSWRGKWSLDGGVFANQASHHIDLLQWMMGEPEEVSAMTATQLVDIEAEDMGIANIRFKNGALGLIEATTATRPRDIEGSISVMGERGRVEISGFAVNEIKVWEFAEPAAEDEEVMARFKENPPNVYGFGHVRYLQHVVDCLKNGRKPLVDGKEGRRSLRLITALYEAAESWKTLELRKMTGKSRLGENK